MHQWGLIKENVEVEIRNKYGRIFHYVSTLPGHSGSPILWVEDLEQERLSIVAIHQAGGTKISNGLQIKLNAGKLLTEELIVILMEESLKMGAERFII